MVLETVDLHDEFLTPPDEIDLETTHARIELRGRESRLADQVEQTPLGLRSGEGGTLLLFKHGPQPRCAWTMSIAIQGREQMRCGHKAPCHGLCDGLLELVGWHSRGDVDQCASG
jgi:hypothetical protein